MKTPFRLHKSLPLSTALWISLSLAAAHAQSFTNSEGIWYYTTDNGSAIISEYYNNVSASLVTVPDNVNGLPVTGIGGSAFSSTPPGDITSVTLPDTITSIGVDAFSGSTITNIVMNNSLTNIGISAFLNSSLVSVTVPGGVTVIGQGAFENCTKLTSAVIANGVTSIGSYMFSGCSSLTNIVLPGTITSIQPYAFDTCSHLTNVLIPSSVTSIEPYAFQGTSSLRGLYYLGNSPFATNFVFQFDSNLTNYYQSFTTGWSNSFDGFPTATWIPPLPALGITTYNQQPVVLFPVTVIGTNYVLLMTTNLTSGNWVVVTNGVLFTGIQITNAPANAFFQLQ